MLPKIVVEAVLPSIEGRDVDLTMSRRDVGQGLTPRANGRC